MPGVLLDSHAFYWLATDPDRIARDALLEIAQHSEQRQVYVSPITAWELMIASRKVTEPPNLGTSPQRWFGQAVKNLRIKVPPIGHRIACEAAAVADITGHKDPGDCYIVATSRVLKIAVITRDAVMRRLARNGHIQVIVC